jgi:hypothetical protein
MIWKVALALVGSIVTAYVFEEVIGGGALGWTVGGAIMGVTCYPLGTSRHNARTLAFEQRNGAPV